MTDQQHLAFTLKYLILKIIVQEYILTQEYTRPPSTNQTVNSFLYFNMFICFNV